VFWLPETATALMICQIAEQFFAQRTVVEALPGRLAVVEFKRVRLRPPLED